MSARLAPQATSFFKIWVPSFAVFVAYGLGTFGLNWWLARSSGGAALLGAAVGIANTVALVVVVLIAGLIDRSSRSRFLLGALAALAVAFGFLFPTYLLDAKGPAVLALGVIAYLLIESALSVYQAALETTVVDLAPSAWPGGRTASLAQLQPQVARFFAPLAGGVLLAAGLLPALPVVSVAAVALTAFTLIRWRSVLPMSGESGKPPMGGRQLLARSLADARDAADKIRSHPVLVFLLVVAITTNLVLFPFYVLLPVFIAEAGFDGPATVYGQAASAYGAGMLLSTAVIARFARRTRRPAFITGLTVLVICGCLALVTVLRSPETLVALMAVLGALFIVLVAVAGGTWIELTPSAVRVRIFSLRRLVSFASIPLGTSLMGYGSAWLGITPFLHGLLVIVAVFIVIAWAALGWYGHRHSGKAVAIKLPHEVP
jgi:hypothetical protein